MGGTTSKRLAGLAVLVAVVATAAVASASEIVIVYFNTMPDPGHGKQLTPVQSKNCDKFVNHGTLTVQVRKGPFACGYKVPVEGDSRQPKMDFESEFRLSKHTPKALRKKTYYGLRMRANGTKKFYETRIFSKTGKWLIKRAPTDKAFPQKGRSKAIKAPGHFNTVQMRMFSKKIQMWVNGKKLAEFNDPSPGDIPGTQLQVIAGVGKKTKHVAEVGVDDVRVAVPKR